MKSPFVDNGLVLLVSDDRTLRYNGIELDCVQVCYFCEKSGRQFTDDKLDDINLELVKLTYEAEHEK